MIQAKDLQKGADQARENAIKLDGKLRGVKEESRAIQVELRGQDSVERSVFEEERVGIEARMEALTAQFQASDEQKKELSTQKADIWQKIKALEKEANEICTVQEETVEQISNNVRVRKNIERDMSRFAQLIESELGDIVKQEMVASEAELEANNMAEGASRICARVHVTRTIKELDNELAAQEDCLKNSEIAQINPVKVKQTLDSKRLQLRESEKSIIGHESLIKTFSTAMEQRLRDWEDFRRSVAKHCTSSFIFMLEARGFQGSLEFRHHDAELCINVLPQILQENTKPQQESEPRGQKRRKTTIIQDETESRDIRQLSGGEKSYSTACFLFSLWHCMGCPIRCLDEFDVYMVNIVHITVL
jgi:chromosome segregation ATPase